MQRLGVGMLRVVEDVVDRRALHHAPEVHHHHLVRHLRDHPHVVGDQHDRHAVLTLQLADQVQDLRLGGDVEGGGGLVGDQQAGAAGQGDGDHGALAQAAGQLERVGVDALLGVGDVHLSQRLDADGARFLLAGVGPVQPDRFQELGVDRVHRAERGHRLLEHQRDLAAADGAHLLAVRFERCQVENLRVPARGRAPEQDLAGDDLAGAVEDAQHRARRDALAAAALAHDAERLAGRHVEARAIHRHHGALVDREVGVQVAHLQDRRRAGAGGGPRVRRVRRSGSAGARDEPPPAVPALAARGGVLGVGVGGVAHAVAEKVEGEHGDDDRDRGNHQPRCERHGLHVLRRLQQGAVADRRRPDAEPEEAQRRLADDHLWNGQGDLGDDVAVERRQHVAEDGLGAARPGELGGGHEVLVAQSQEPSAHHPRQAGPAEHRDDDGDREVDLQHAPVARQERRQPHPERDRGNRADDLDGALDHRIDHAAVESGDAAEQDAEEQAQRHPDQADRHRHAGAVHHPRPEVAALDVGAEQEQGRRRRVGGTEQVDVGGEDPQQLVGEAAREQAHRVLAALVLGVDALEGARVARALHREHVRP